jgi:hypothetical protein
MTEATPIGATGTGAGSEDQADAGQNTGDLSNREAKDLPWVKDLKVRAARADALEKEIADRKVADKKAEDDAAIKKAEDAKNYEEAQRLRDEAHQAEIDALKRKNTTFELKAALAAEGFGKRGIDFLATEYSAKEHPDIADYVKTVTEAEENKVFLKEAGERKPLDAMGKLPANTGSSNLSNDQIRALKASDDPNDRAKGRKYLEDYYDKHGSLPPGYV